MAYPYQMRKDAAVARKYMDIHGFYGGTGGVGPQGQVCIVVALMKTVGVLSRESDVLMAMREITGSHCMVTWASKPGRTKEEVLAVFDHIAKP